VGFAAAGPMDRRWTGWLHWVKGVAGEGRGLSSAFLSTSPRGTTAGIRQGGDRMSYLGILLLLNLLILIHEAGHLAAAKLVGIPVAAFSVLTFRTSPARFLGDFDGPLG